MNEKALWEAFKNDKNAVLQQCPDINDLAAYIDNRLSDDEKKKMEEHLNNCPKCLESVLAIKQLQYDIPAHLEDISKAQALLVAKSTANEPTKRFPASWMAASVVFVLLSFGGYVAGKGTYMATDETLQAFLENDLQPIASVMGETTIPDFFELGEIQ
ncbi:anti-sigma factor family protein [Hydrogenimonas cancrithermarum]|uniref:Putative zinc-finger domain-containing protein n=1 Tax=Hydrogenimonas cancrithermarum TaxID=2993563 RepID=A0ABN6WTQ9_9BACT|nr:zf-HC2 domain-containing protein [Hydrogenimonas cancrithermarum]BDY12060.1 hypothetical protein HCR_03720 [Hydrogenimonas cancrithermarum]